MSNNENLAEVLNAIGDALAARGSIIETQKWQIESLRKRLEEAEEELNKLKNTERE